MRLASLLPALGAMLALPVPAAGEPADDPLAAVPVIAATEVSFIPGDLLLTPESLERLRPVLAKARDSTCYWLARGRNADEAKTLQAALAENDIALEKIATDIEPLAHVPEARLYCAPPPLVSIHFLPGRADLTEEARQDLGIAAVGYWSSGQPLSVRGYAGPDETPDPLQLGLDRAQSARSYLIGLGLPPLRLTIEANTEASGRDALRADIMPRRP